MFLLGRLSHHLKGEIPQHDHRGEVVEGKRITSQECCGEQRGK